jgi:hypothetical protein
VASDPFILLAILGWFAAAVFLFLWHLSEHLLVQVGRERDEVAAELKKVDEQIEDAQHWARHAIVPLLDPPHGELPQVNKNALSLLMQRLGMDHQGNPLAPEEEDEEEFYGD